MRIIRLTMALVLLGFLLPACSGGGPDDPGPVPPPKSLAERYPIDGIIDLSSFPSAMQRTIDIRDTFGAGTLVKTVILRWAMENDDRNLYVALEWGDDTENGYSPPALDDFDGIALLFDNDGDGVLEQDEERTA